MNYDINKCVKEWVAGRKLICFSAGETLKKIIHRGLDYRLISYVCDNNSNKWNTVYNGIPVCNPDVLLSENRDNIVVVITGIYYDEIEKQLDTMGLKEVCLPWLVFETLGKFSDKNVSKCIDENREKIISVKNMLYDDQSKIVFETVIEKLIKNDHNFREIYQWPQYFIKEIVTVEDQETYVDAGLYNGDTIKDFIRFTGNKYKSVYGFEPEQPRYEEIKKTFEDEKRINILPFALYNENTDLKFAIIPYGSSHIESDGELIVKAKKLDDLGIRDKITFIKMDIEGAEKDALLGASKIIKECKPKLAISLYHNIEDLWEIPLLIKSMNPDYRFYIRHHSLISTETVLYAIE